MKILFTILMLALAIPAGAAQRNQAAVMADTNSALLYPTAANLIKSNWGGMGPQIQTRLNPATNTYAGIVAALTFNPATNTFVGTSNALGFGPATNSYAGVVAALTFNPATNSVAWVLWALGFTPTQLGGTNTWTGTNRFNNLYNRVTAQAWTNTGLADLGLGIPWIATNNITAAAPTGGSPNGGLMVSTNGCLYIRSNNVWLRVLTE